LLKNGSVAIAWFRDDVAAALGRTTRVSQTSKASPAKPQSESRWKSITELCFGLPSQTPDALRGTSEILV
jgi:hypothetical protein